MTTPSGPLAGLLAAQVPSVSVAALTSPKSDLQVAGSPGCSPYTLFQAASTSKAVAALVALILVDQGKLKLDDSVAGHLKSWTLTDFPGLPITLRSLLCHAGAVSISSFPGYPPKAPLPSMTQILDGLPPSATAPVRVTGKPMTTTLYSGGGYQIVQLLLEEVTGKSMADLVTELVLRPLGMFNAQYHQPGPEEAAHAKVGGDYLPDGWRVYPELAAAGLWCTAADLARFAAGVQAAVAGQPGAVLSQKLAKEMVTEQLPGSGWGLGLKLAGSGPGKRFGHDGRNRGYVCEFTATVAPGPAIAVMTASDQGARVIHQLLPAIRGLLKWPDPTACVPSATLPADPPPTPDQEAQMAAVVAGNYRTTTGTQLTLAGSGWNWRLTIGTQPPVALEVLPDQSLSSPDVQPVLVTFTLALPATITVIRPGSPPFSATHV